MFIAKPNLFNRLAINNVEKNNFYSIEKAQNGIWYTSNRCYFNSDKKKLFFDSLFVNDNFRFLLNYNKNLYYEKNNAFFNFVTHKKLNSLFFKNPSIVYHPNCFTYINKQLWLSNSKNIFYLENDTLIEDALITSKIKDAEIFQIKNFNKNVLIFTSKNNYEYNPRLKQIKPIKGIKNIYIRYVKIIDSKSYWVGCYGDGLYLVKNNKAYKVNDRNINIATAHAIEEDKKGDLWISTNEGLLVINKAVAISKTLNNKLIECYRYTTEDGFDTNEFNGGCTHPSFRDTDGSLGFPSIKGIVWFYPDKVIQQSFTGQVVIDQVKAEEQIIPLINNTYSIPATADLISIDFSYPYYYNRENLSVEYRFANDKEWRKITGSNFKLVRSQIGTQQLLMRIRTHNKIENEYKVQSFNFDFEKRYYEEVWFWVSIAIILLGFFRVSYIFGLHYNKKREQQLQNKVTEKTKELIESVAKLELSKEQLSKSLHEKEILLKEIHHRVKNNLQIVMSLLSIEAHEGKSKKIADFLEVSESRIQSMLLIHQGLYENDQLDSILFQGYLEHLVDNLKDLMRLKIDHTQFEIEAKNIFFDIETGIPLGLIINELLTNTFKHAFPNQQAGKVNISINQLSEIDFELIYSDNGIGFDATQNESQSFGMELVKMLVKQLKGTVTKEAAKGTKYKITFKQINK